MNKTRRQQLNECIDRIEAMREHVDAIGALLPDLADMVETIRDDEQEAFDAMPESLQAGDRGADTLEAIEHMTTAFDDLAALRDALDAFDVDVVVSHLDDAKGAPA